MRWLTSFSKVVAMMAITFLMGFGVSFFPSKGEIYSQPRSMMEHCFFGLMFVGVWVVYDFFKAKNSNSE
jgi:hypothetical protein